MGISTSKARTVLVVGCVVWVAAMVSHAGLHAQAPARGAAGAGQMRLHGTLLQVMRGVIYPASNVVFAAQEDPAAIKPADDPSTSPNPLSSSYGGWIAVENAGITLAESANLLEIPGRMCGNGKPAPIRNADWQTWVGELREAAVGVYQAGQAKNDDVVLEAADKLATACLHCHAKYRNVPGGNANRC